MVKLKKFKKQTTIVLLTVALIVFTPGLIEASNTTLPKNLYIAFRTDAPQIASIKGSEYTGVCSVIAEELKIELDKKGVELHYLPEPIQNMYKSPEYPRFWGLFNKETKEQRKENSGYIYDVQCGPESREALNLIYETKDQESGKVLKRQLYRELIRFSPTPIHTTSLALMLETKWAEELEEASKKGEEELRNLLESYTIIAVNNTTTATQLKGKSNIYPNYKIVDAIQNDKEDTEPHVQNINLRDQALNELENKNGAEKAFLTDHLMIENLLENGIADNTESQNARESYKTKGFSEFMIPKEFGSLAFHTENYHIAINRNTDFANELNSIIEEVLKLPNVQEEITKLNEKPDPPDGIKPSSGNGSGITEVFWDFFNSLGEKISEGIGEGVFDFFKDTIPQWLGEIFGWILAIISGLFVWHRTP